MRIGYGYDIHQLAEGRKLIIGGVKIPYKLGLLGHSDADVLLHAVTDGILGAAGLGDIGDHFPDTDMDYKDADSALLLKQAFNKVKAEGYSVNNIDCTIFAQEVRITPVKDEIKNSISRILGIEKELINIKAKTMEKLDAVGSNKAIAASCVVLISK